MMDGVLHPCSCSMKIYRCVFCRLIGNSERELVVYVGGSVMMGFTCQHPWCMAGVAAVSNQEEAIVSF